MTYLTAHIKQLELKLLHCDPYAYPSTISELLGDAFEEIGSNGHVNSRQSVIEWLLHKEANQRWTLENFRIKQLSDSMSGTDQVKEPSLWIFSSMVIQFLPLLVE